MQHINWDFTTTTTLVIFCATYAGIAIGHIWGLRLDRTAITMLGAIAMLAFGCILLPDAVKSVNMESIIMLFGLMVIAGQLHYAGFYHRIADRIAAYLEKPALFLIILMIASGLLSAFLNNDVVCFAFTPVVTAALLKKKMNPVPFLIALALSSNIGCALTMIGNAQNVLIGEISHLGFGAYIAWVSVPVVLSMGAAYGIVYLLGKGCFFQQNADETSLNIPKDDTEFKPWRAVKGVGAICVIVILFFTPLPRYLVTLAGAGLLLCSHKLESKKVLGLVDWQLLILFISLFVVVGAFHQTGLAKHTIDWVRQYGLNLQNPYMLSLTTGILSNFINNSAAVMLLVKVVDLDNKSNGYILALSNTFAGNLFLIGSVANLIVVQGAEKYGIKISFWNFAKYGVPVAVTSFIILLGWIVIMV